MYCQEYNNLRSELHSLISKTDAYFATLSDYDKITYYLNLRNDNTCKLVSEKKTNNQYEYNQII